MATNISITDNLKVQNSVGGSSNQVIVEDPSVIAESGNSAHVDTTLFVDDANVVTRDLSHAAHIDNTFLDLQDTDTMTQDIISFLGKPIVLASGSFSTTDTYSFLNNYSMPYAAFTATQGIVWTQKLAGIFGIRMDMRFRIVINANRFQQGRYCIGWVPLAAPLKSVSSLKELLFNNSHMATLVQRTTIPHVEFDLCNDTTAELVVPYVSCRNFYEMNSVLSSADNYPLGFLNVYPYSPLVSPAGSTTCGYTLYVSFENVKLFGAASAQSGISDREVSNKGNGPISSVSTAISRGFKEFAKVPLLSSYALTVSWIADRVTGVANVFGWSKPTQGDSLTKMVLFQAANHNTVDGDSDARPLSYLSKPGVTKINGVSGTEYDEMDFSYIVRKPAWFQTYGWTTSDVTGTVLATILNTPAKQYVVGGATHFQPVAFVNSMFMHWRGSLRYRLKFVRTEFHSGRIQIAFYPGTSLTTYTGNAAYVHRMIVDIRETPEIDFVVPYISAGAYSTGATGTIIISVTDSLVAPAVVSSSIGILAEICGGEDLEFAIPQNFAYTPRAFVPQSGLNEDKLTVTNIGSTKVSANPVVNSAVAIGDKVSSFRAYLKRFHPIQTNNLGVLSTNLLNGFAYSVATDVITGLNTANPTDYIRSDITGTVASCYALWRGGIRIRAAVNKNMFITTAVNVNSPSMSRTFSTPYNSNGFGTGMFYASVTTSEVNGNAHVHMQDLRNNAIITAEMPQYNGLVARSVCDAMGYQGGAATQQSAIGVDGSLTNCQLGMALPYSQTNTISASPIAGFQLWTFYRALADDGDFGCFISVPAMYLTNVTSGTNPSFY